MLVLFFKSDFLRIGFIVRAFFQIHWCMIWKGSKFTSTVYVMNSSRDFFFVWWRIQYLPWYGCACFCCFRDFPHILSNVFWHRCAWPFSRLVYPACLHVLPLLETCCYHNSLGEGHFSISIISTDSAEKTENSSNYNPANQQTGRDLSDNWPFKFPVFLQRPHPYKIPVIKNQQSYHLIQK